MLADGRLALPLKGAQYATRASRTYWLIVAPAAARRDEVKVFADWIREQTTLETAPAPIRARTPLRPSAQRNPRRQRFSAP